MAKPYLVVPIGDLHSGGSTAICPPGARYYGENEESYNPILIQTELYSDYKLCLKWVKQVLKNNDYRLFVVFMGDMVEGVAHHRSRETNGNEESQRDLAVELLLPFANMADEMVGVWGSEAHVAVEGMGDKGVYRELGCLNVGQNRVVEINGRVHHLTHHSSTGRQGHTWLGGMQRLLQHEHDMWADEQRAMGQTVRPYDVIGRAHVHFLTYYDWADKDMAGWWSGSWQMPTQWVNTKHYRNHHIGMLMYEPKPKGPAWHDIKRFWLRPDEVRVYK